MKENTKDKIIRIAVELLESEGIRSLTQPAVAKRVGIPQGQLTYHFPKRSDLVLAVADSAINRIAEFVFEQATQSAAQSLSGTQSEKRGPQSQVIDMIWALVRNHARIRALLSLVVEADDNEAVSQRLRDHHNRARMLIAMGMSAEADDAAVTMAHATMLGFGILSFIGGEDEKKLHQDFEFAMQRLQDVQSQAAQLQKVKTGAAQSTQTKKEKSKTTKSKTKGSRHG